MTSAKDNITIGYVLFKERDKHNYSFFEAMSLTKNSDYW